MSISRVDQMDDGPPDQDQACAQISGVITVQIEPCGEHLDRRITIQGAKLERFYNASRGIASRRSILDLTGTIFSETVHRGRFIVTVDRFDRTITPKKPIKRCVLHDSKHPS